MYVSDKRAIAAGLEVVAFRTCSSSITARISSSPACVSHSVKAADSSAFSVSSAVDALGSHAAYPLREQDKNAITKMRAIIPRNSWGTPIPFELL
jgi:hypothetical protein